MNFVNGTVHSIRSISQKGLAVAWGRLAKGRLPSFDQFVLDPRIHDQKQLALWKVEAEGGEPVFRAMYRGSLIGEAFKDGWNGKTLTEVTPPSLQPAIINASRRCATAGCAVYTILKTCDGEGFAVNLERLLLPFGSAGRVELILASLQLISLQGTAERRSIVGYFEAECETVLAMTIPAANVILSPKRDAKSDGFVTTS